MYQVENSGSVVRSRGKRPPLWHAWRLVAPNVLFLGLTSFFTDISSEMVATVLPLYLIFTLQLAPFQYGLIDGLYQGAAVLVRLLGGVVADRLGRYKAVATAGYGLSALCRVGLLFIGASWGAIAGLVLVDRTGKGIRTAPRDALIALSTPPAELATAFGVHRALDTAGAMIGPLLAFLLLSLAPGAFDTIFVVSFCFALLGLGVLTLFVENRTPEAPPSEQPAPPQASLRAALGLLRRPRFAALTAAGALLGLTTLSDGFIYLNLQRRLDLAFGFFPLLFVVTAFIYMLLAVPAGRLADRVGRTPVFIGGYALLLLVYLILLIPAAPPVALFASLALLGAYYAATDGVLMALGSLALPAQLRASGLALLSTAVGLARLCASVLFGLAWTWFGAQGALLGFLAGLLLATLAATFVLRKIPEAPNEP
jgi:MFS family permease